MIPSRMEAVRIQLPLLRGSRSTKGTMTTRPKKPYTTEGMPANSSTAGCRTLRVRLLAKNAIYMAVIIPTGTPSNTAPAVTYTLPNIMGKMPYRPLLGRQVVPSRKSPRPISAMAGMPLAKRKIQINATARMDTQATSRKTIFANVSLMEFMDAPFEALHYAQMGTAARRPRFVVDWVSPGSRSTR